MTGGAAGQGAAGQGAAGQGAAGQGAAGQGAAGQGWRATGLTARQFAPTVGVGALGAGCGVGLLATSGWLITSASERPPVLSLCIAIGAVQAFSLGRGVFRYLQRLGVHRLSLDVLGRLRLQLYDAVVPLVPGGLGPRSSGTVLSGFVSDTEVVADGFAKTTTAAVDVTASIVLGALVATLVEPVLGAILLGGSAVVVAFSLALSRLGTAIETHTAAERSSLAAAVAQTVRSAPELVAFGRQDLVDQRLEEVRRRSASLGAKRAWALGLGRGGAMAGAGAVLAAVVAAGLAGRAGGRLSGVALAVAAFATLAVMDQCANLPSMLAGRSSALAASGRLRDLGDLAPPAREPANDDSAMATGGSGRLERAEVRAPDGTARLRGVSLEVGSGEHLALVGPSGAGKTSAVHALLHFVECSAGRACLGEVNVAEMTREGIARLAGWVPDETHIFAASLAANLRLARPSASDAECAAALVRAGLAGWLAGLPDGLRTLLGAGGRPVSAGERQRIGLARVLLGGAPLLVLDEPTAHLDPATSAQVLAELLDATAGRSVLVVSHDPGIAAHVDRLVALDSGVVAAVTTGALVGRACKVTEARQA